ncbi:hypothetical protein HDU78_011355, partial [Chytriomyces hyalinus]
MKTRKLSLAAKFRMHLEALQADSERPCQSLLQTELKQFFDMEISDYPTSHKLLVNPRSDQKNSRSEDMLQQTLNKYICSVPDAAEHDGQVSKEQRSHRQGIKYDGKSERTMYRIDKSARDERAKHSGGIAAFFPKVPASTSTKLKPTQNASENMFAKLPASTSTKLKPTQNASDNKIVVEEEDVADILSALSGSEINPLLCQPHT